MSESQSESLPARFVNASLTYNKDSVKAVRLRALSDKSKTSDQYAPFMLGRSSPDLSDTAIAKLESLHRAIRNFAKNTKKSKGKGTSGGEGTSEGEGTSRGEGTSTAAPPPQNETLIALTGNWKPGTVEGSLEGQLRAVKLKQFQVKSTFILKAGSFADLLQVDAKDKVCVTDVEVHGWSKQEDITVYISDWVGRPN